jgi:outer membrane protein assembly factor BamA
MNFIKKLALLSFSAFLSASAQSYTAKKIVFKHPGSFTQGQLEAASGLHADMKVTGEDVGAAAQKLADSQYFDNVTGAMDAGSGGIIVTFDLAPAPAAKFLPAGFENLVWLTPTEIDAAIRSKVPLYDGTMAEGSSAVDDASSALKEALAAKGVQARIECESVEPSLQHPVRVLEFRVVNPVVRVENIKVIGVTQALIPLLQTSVNKTARTLYNAGLNGPLTSDSLLAPIKDAGYVKAQLADESVDTGTASNGIVPVVVHATLNAGETYHLGKISFAGTPLYSTEEFDKNAKLKPGELASAKLLYETLEPLRSAYLSKGYLDVVVKADPVFDETAKTVSYNVSVTAGEPYMLHDIVTQGLDDPAAQADFKRGFALKLGEPFNPTYVRGFIKENTALRAFQTYTGTYKATAFPATHTVDLVMVFAGGTTNVNVH